MRAWMTADFLISYMYHICNTRSRAVPHEAADVFFLTGTDGKKICDTKCLKQIREAVLAALG